jgi:antitoxin component of MazEF toxin-antitoxin module
MALRKVFKTGGTVVVAIPKSFRDALRLVPGTPVVVTLKDRALTITRAVITGENLLGAPDPSLPPAGARQE